MHRKPIVLLLFFSFLGLGVVYILLATTKKDEGVNNGFMRRFIAPRVMEVQRVLDLEFNSYYIAGKTEHGIYLGNSEGALRIVRASVRLDTAHILFTLQDAEKFSFRSIKVRVDSPFYYLVDGTVPVVFKGKLDEQTAIPFLKPVDFFVDAIPLGRSAFAIKSLMKPDNELFLGKLQHLNAASVFKPEILKKQIDGIFCKEGHMVFDQECNRLVYTHYYRNEFIVMDSNEMVQYRAHTIDTNVVAKLEIVRSEKKGFVTTSSPPQIVNKYTAVQGDRLFIHSRLKADNETTDTFKEHSVIDIYDLESGSYQSSFYLPNYKGKRLSQFSVTGNVLFAIYGNYLAAFMLPKELFNSNKNILHVRSGMKAEHL